MMYKIVENQDGSTGVFSSKTGELICSVNSKKNPVGISHPIRRADSPAVSSPRTLQMGLACNKLNNGQKRRESLESANSMKLRVSPIISCLDDDSSSDDFPPLPADDQASTVGDFSDDCISQDEFLQCLGAISTQKLKDTSFEELQKTFPLRVISKVREECAVGSELQVKVLEEVEIASPLGVRVLQSSPHHELDESGVLTCVNKCEKYCTFSAGSAFCGGSIPTLRNRDLLTKYPLTYRQQKNWRPDPFVYSFTKKQRQERLKSLKTGLNKQGRKLKRLCRDCSVKLTRLDPKEIKSWLKRKTNPPPAPAVCTPKFYHYLGTGGDMRQAVMVAGKNGNATLRPVSLLLMNNISVHSKNHTGTSCLPMYGHMKAGFAPVKSSPMKLYLQNGKPRLNSPVKPSFSSDSDNNDDIQILFIKPPSAKSEQPASRRKAKVSSSAVRNCSVPLQDVSKQIDKVGGKCFVKGTAIKACGIKGDKVGAKPNNVLVNNNFVNANRVATSNLLDHAYHRNPLMNSAHQAARLVGRNNRAIRVKNVVVNKPHLDRENIQKIAIPRVGAALPNTQRFGSVIVKKVDPPRLPGFKYSRPAAASVLVHNGGNVHFKRPPVSVKVPQRTYSVSQGGNVKRNIQVIDITDDSPRENLSPVKKKSNTLKWVFQCYGCGFRGIFFSNSDFNEAVAKHMTQYHSVTEPDSFLKRYLNKEECAIVTEAFPGYKQK